MVDFAHMGSCKPYLVSIAGISGRSLAAYDLLRELARHGVGDFLVDVTRTCNPHGLVDIASA